MGAFYAIAGLDKLSVEKEKISLLQVVETVSHSGWLSNKLVELVVPGRARVQTRIVGLDNKTVILLAPWVDGKTVWPNLGSPVQMVITGHGTDTAAVSGSIVDRKLKPFPLLYIALDSDIPFTAAVSARSQKIVAVASGKGGTGKTFFSLNLAWELALCGHQSLLIDLDLGTANIATSLGLNPPADLSAVVTGKKQITEVIYPIASGLALIPGAARNQSFADLSPWQLQRLASGLGQLEENWDYLILDTGAGLSLTTTTFLYCADYIIIVTNDTPTAIVDGYGLVKAISSQFWIPRGGVVINRALDDSEADLCAQRFIETAKNFIGVNLDYLGAIPEDSSVVKSLKATRPTTALFPQAPASTAIKAVSKRLGDLLQPQNPKSVFSVGQLK